MKKVKVYELAKQYNMSSRELISLLREEFQLEFSSHLSGIEESDVEKIKQTLNNLNNSNKSKTNGKVENIGENKNQIISEKEKNREERNREEKNREEKNKDGKIEKEEREEEREEERIKEERIKEERIKEEKIKEEKIKEKGTIEKSLEINKEKQLGENEIKSDKENNIEKNREKETEIDSEKDVNKKLKFDKGKSQKEGKENSFVEKGKLKKRAKDKWDEGEENFTDNLVFGDPNEKDETEVAFENISSKVPFSVGKKEKNRKKKGKRSDFTMKTASTNATEIIEEDGIKLIKIRGEITLGEFAEKIGVSSGDLIKKLFLKGQMLTINSPVSIELAAELGEKYNVLVEQEEEQVLEFGEKFDLEIDDKKEDLEERPPIITIMGHVDHGKTSLLDAIRSSNVVDGEAGGITQKIGAYQVIKDGKSITFVDTPGHEAFTDMRARGAQVTDIAILVVAADDGVMPQTVEAISHARAANVPIVVAVNKIDKPDANPMKVKQGLMEHGLVSIEWGGDTEFVEISAKKRMNLDSLLDTILITAEILELKANHKKRAKGVVLESRLDTKVGPIVDLIIQEGQLKIGDVIVAGEVHGKVRALINDKGERIDIVGVSQPVEIIGFNQVPEAGEILYVIKNEQHAKRMVEEMAKERKMKETKRKNVSLESLSDQFEHENIKELNLVLRADSKGSVDALRESLEKLSNNEVVVRIIQAASGAITESDVKLASASNAIIIGFHIRPTTKAIKEAELSGVEIRTSNIIYHITEDIEKALSGMLDPEFKEIYLGRIEIKKVFKVSKVGNIAGCIVVDGKVKVSCSVRILRNGIIVYEGKLSSLKRYKDDVKEVTAGQECGLGIENFNDIKEGDIVENFEIEEIKRVLK
ncbi:MAG: translation initiation factor IF-2 [Fusobacteriaceae bacterium]|jgi:translation initiation factor IF-2|nr:translation initiation factor IF-2 [Fusobacteriaceae bacterium]